MRIIAMTIAALAALSTASAVEYVGGEVITYNDGWGMGGVYLQQHAVLAIWTSKVSPDGPIYGVSILPRTDIRSRKPLKGNGPPTAYPIPGAIFIPEADSLLAGDKASDVLAAIGLSGDPSQVADQARTRLAEIKAAAMKLIKP